MALDFPNNPSDGDEFNGFTYDASRGVWNNKVVSANAAAGGSSVTVSDTAPTSPSEGDMWFNSTLVKTYVYYGSTWVVLNPSGTSSSGGASVTAYANFAAFPSSGNTAGDMGFAEDTKALYVWDGTGWDRVHSGPNEGPLWSTEPPSSLDLASDGSTTTVTVAATDPEGFDISYAHSTNPSSQSLMTVTNNDDGTFTLTPSTDSANAGSVTLRIVATDGIVYSEPKYTVCNLAFIDAVNIATYGTEWFWADSSVGIAGSASFSIGNNNSTWTMTSHSGSFAGAYLQPRDMTLSTDEFIAVFEFGGQYTDFNNRGGGGVVLYDASNNIIEGVSAASNDTDSIGAFGFTNVDTTYQAYHGSTSSGWTIAVRMSNGVTRWWYKDTSRTSDAWVKVGDGNNNGTTIKYVGVHVNARSAVGQTITMLDASTFASTLTMD